MKLAIGIAMLVAVIGPWGNSARAESLGELEPEKEASLLAGRLLLVVPSAMTAEPRRPSIMAAEAAAEDETRLVLDVGDKRLVVMVEELYAKAGDDFAKTVSSYVGSWSDSAEPYELRAFEVRGATLQVQSITPKEVLEREATFLLGLFVRTPDGLVQMVSFYANPEAVTELDAAQKLSLAIARTLRGGKRPLDLTARKVAVPVYGYELRLRLNDGMAMSAQPGPDFTVFRFFEVSVLGKGGGVGGIYLGGHPSYQHRQQADLLEGDVTAVDGKIASQDVAWQVWTAQWGRTTHEAILPVPGSAQDFLHVWASGADAAQVDAMRAVIDTLEVGK